MHLNTISKRALCSAMSLALGCGGISSASADITLTFANNTSPVASPPLTVLPPSNPAFDSSTEFRVVTKYGGVNDGHKNAMFGGEQWIFNTSKQMTGTAGVPSGNPGASGTQAPITSGVASFPLCAAAASANCPVLEQDAPFFSSGFNFLAPTVGSVAATAYGAPATTTLNFTTNTLTVFLPVANAQWATGNYVIGADPTRSPPLGIANGDKLTFGVAPTGPGVTFTGTISNVVNGNPLTFNYRLFGERTMTRDEVTVPAFAAQTVQWELPGSAAIGNQNPVATADNPSASAGATTVLTVRANDTDPDWTLLGTTSYDTLTITALGTPNAGGAVTTNGSTISYTPVILSGPESFTYTLSDGRGGTAVGTVNVTVILSGSNVPPTANDDADAATNEGVPVVIDVLANDTDSDIADTLSVSAVTQGTNGSVVNNTTNVTYTPNPGYFGTDSFTYTLFDGTDTDTATVTVTVSEYTEASAGTVTSFTGFASGDFNVDSDVDSSCVGGCFGFTITGVPSGGQVNITLPVLAGDVPTNPAYRKYINGAWQALAAPDVARSAPLGSNGRCPAPGSSSYVALTTGHKCIQLTLTDNGGNDTDGNLTVLTDPGGLASLTAAAASEVKLSTGGGGCAMNTHAGSSLRGDWWILGGFVAWLGLTLRRKHLG